MCPCLFSHHFLASGRLLGSKQDNWKVFPSPTILLEFSGNVGSNEVDTSGSITKNINIGIKILRGKEIFTI